MPVIGLLFFVVYNKPVWVICHAGMEIKAISEIADRYTKQMCAKRYTYMSPEGV